MLSQGLIGKQPFPDVFLFLLLIAPQRSTVQTPLPRKPELLVNRERMFWAKSPTVPGGVSGDLLCDVAECDIAIKGKSDHSRRCPEQAAGLRRRSLVFAAPEGIAGQEQSPEALSWKLVVLGASANLLTRSAPTSLHSRMFTELGDGMAQMNGTSSLP